jgi:hypothetical protein
MTISTGNQNFLILNPFYDDSSEDSDDPMESELSDEQVQYARTSLMVSEKLPEILERWYCPLQNHHKEK